MPSCRREMARADTKPPSERECWCRRVHHVASQARGPGGGEAGDDREQHRQHEVGGVRVARGAGRELGDQHGERQRDQRQLGDDRPAARGLRTAYAGELGGQRVPHDHADRDAGDRDRGDEHQRGGRPADPRHRHRQPVHQPGARQAVAHAQRPARPRRGRRRRAPPAARTGPAPTAAGTRPRAARPAPARAPGSRWPPSAAASAARARRAPATARRARSRRGRWPAARGPRRARRPGC